MIQTFLAKGVAEPMPFRIRDETTDWNTINACCVADEYDLDGVLQPGKLLFDIGTHVGGVAVWAAKRGCRVVAVEPLPENVSELRTNASLNGVDVEIVVGAIGADLIHYCEGAHEYIGNSTGSEVSRSIAVDCINFTALAHTRGVPDIVKLDCEGGEWTALYDPTMRLVPLVVGEWHPGRGEGAIEAYGSEDVIVALGATHDITFSGPTAGPGGFRAMLRG